ncbi:hypothetical protein KVA01_04960 [Kocuria varians]|uniref:DUF4307 domain-containing protein n=1 Tax=Kocuria varians TaxID=1272 RepID=A0A4Y4CZN1_KOCVA|nr:DUF4307 domain-containing protein [Kocuria varians]GEC98341.1 hypothetical protein KVA01_04960 [Kocuria varians]
MSSATPRPATGTTPASEAERVLARRYGGGHRTVGRPSRRGPSPRGWIVISVVGTLLASLFVVWIVWGNSQKPVAKDVSFQITDAGHVYADFDLTKDPDQSVTCAMQALNEQHAVVGWREVTIGHVAEDELNGRTSTHRVPLRTTGIATTAGVESCRATGG